jgi:hypothetical protein
VFFGLSLDNEIFIPLSMAVLEEYNSLDMDLQILLRLNNFGSFIMVAARMIVLAIFFPAATSLTMVSRTLDSPAMLTRLFGYFSRVYWCWYFAYVD